MSDGGQWHLFAMQFAALVFAMVFVILAVQGKSIHGRFWPLCKEGSRRSGIAWMGCGGVALGARLSCWEVVGEVVWEAGANRNGPRCPHPTRPPTEPPTKHPTKHHSAAVGRRQYKLQARIERTLPTID